MNQRTEQQNKGLHLFFEQLADHLNANNMGMKTVLAVKEVDIDWDKETVKRVLWKPIMKAKYDKDSTAQLGREEISDIHEILMKLLGEKCGVSYLEFPHKVHIND